MVKSLGGEEKPSEPPSAVSASKFLPNQSYTKTVLDLACNVFGRKAVLKLACNVFDVER